MLHFLKILYTGYTEALTINDFDEIHKLCQLLGISFNNSVFKILQPDQRFHTASKGMIYFVD